ncbi:MAG: metalloregulator ArsR/SmtB family transcription factor [Candidatus Brocadiia bacterium]
MNEEAALFKALSDPIRLRLAILLAVRGETCVCFLAQALREPDSKVSRHLSIMRASGMVEARREGTWMHYRLADPRNCVEGFLQDCLRGCFAQQKTVKSDLKRLSRACCTEDECTEQKK